MTWQTLPDSLILQVFSKLDFRSLCVCALVCKSWSRVSNDESLWRNLFYNDYKIDRRIEREQHSSSFKSEYKRLYFHSPIIECDTLYEHTNQVLHVTFSNCGRYFSSCSKDGFVKVWRADCHPFRVKFSKDMKAFNWNYTQFSQFNETDTLLLVSGVHFGAQTASGEIAVFSLRDFQLQCRVLNKPYDIFGAWYTNEYLLSGRLHFLGNFVSCSDLWLNKAYQESESERKPIVKRLFKFYNTNASSIRTILISNCMIDEKAVEGSNSEAAQTCAENKQKPTRGNPISKQLPISAVKSRRLRALQTQPNSSDNIDLYGAHSNEACSTHSPIRYSMDCRAESKESVDCVDTPTSESSLTFSDPPLPWDEKWCSLSDDDQEESSCNAQESSSSSSDDESREDSKDDRSEGRILDQREKLLIFTMSSVTYTPHQIGFKRIKPFRFQEFVKDTLTLSTALKEKRAREENHLQPSPNWHDESVIRDYFDGVDYVIDIKGHIIGMTLSVDHRYLYVNSRSWPENYVIENPLSPPPIAQQIDISVIDLKTLKKVGKMFKSHKAYTPNNECFFIFLDVNQKYVASGAEDKHCYIWDHHYGNCLAKLPHSDVVNCVAFSRKDSQILLSSSDDNTIKVWRSRHRMNQLKQRLSRTVI